MCNVEVVELCWVFRDKVNFEQRKEGSEGGRQKHIWAKSFRNRKKQVQRPLRVNALGIFKEHQFLEVLNTFWRKMRYLLGGRRLGRIRIGKEGIKKLDMFDFEILLAYWYLCGLMRWTVETVWDSGQRSDLKLCTYASSSRLTGS